MLLQTKKFKPIANGNVADSGTIALTLKDPFISESCIEIKAFIKPFEAPQRSVKIKIYSLCPGLGR